ncbi:hypothetical protein OF83DRAFT_1036576, partial [Amylostereum chailletii]
HIQLLKCGGRFHDPTGIADMVAGSCAVECPTCPHPSINLPLEYTSAAPHL